MFSCPPTDSCSRKRELPSLGIWREGSGPPLLVACLEMSGAFSAPNQNKNQNTTGSESEESQKTLRNTDCPRAGIGRRARFRFPFSRFTAFNRVLFFRGIWDHTHPAVPPKSGTDTGGGHPQMWAGYFIIAPFIVDGAGGGLEISRAPNHDGFCC